MFSVGLFAQNKAVTISGIVLDSASQLPLPYTAIQVKRKNQGMSTKDDGTFSIECTKTDTLVFSRLGHKSFMLAVRNTEGTIKIFFG